MISMNVVMSGLKEQLENSVRLLDLNFNVTQGELVNENLNLTPWLGIYIKNVRHNPTTVAVTNRRWKGEVTLVLVVQATHLNSGEDCGKLLEKYNDSVITAIINDTTFGNAIDKVNDLSVDYSYKRESEDTMYFQESYITLTVELEHEND